MQANEEYMVIVDKIVLGGPHGPYAIGRLEEKDIKNKTITFSLTPPGWEEGLPEPGTYVILSDVRIKRGGWRAMRGRFMRPSDEKKQASSKEQ